MERLECSQATLYRLVGELRDFLGAPIEQDSETRGFYYDRSRDNLGIGFSIEPRILAGRLGRVGGIPIPPVGVAGLE